MKLIATELRDCLTGSSEVFLSIRQRYRTLWLCRFVQSLAVTIKMTFVISKVPEMNEMKVMEN